MWLGAATPDSTDNVTLCRAIRETTVTSFNVCNVTGTAATLRVFIDIDDRDDYSGDASNALYYDYSLDANTSLAVQPDWCIPQGGALIVRSGTANALCFTAFGVRG